MFTLKPSDHVLLCRLLASSSSNSCSSSFSARLLVQQSAAFQTVVEVKHEFECVGDCDMMNVFVDKRIASFKAATDIRGSHCLPPGNCWVASRPCSLPTLRQQDIQYHAPDTEKLRHAKVKDAAAPGHELLVCLLLHLRRDPKLAANSGQSTGMMQWQTHMFLPGHELLLCLLLHLWRRCRRLCIIFVALVCPSSRRAVRGSTRASVAVSSSVVCSGGGDLPARPAAAGLLWLWRLRRCLRRLRRRQPIRSWSYCTTRHQCIMRHQRAFDEAAGDAEESNPGRPATRRITASSAMGRTLLMATMTLRLPPAEGAVMVYSQPWAPSSPMSGAPLSQKSRNASSFSVSLAAIDAENQAQDTWNLVSQGRSRLADLWLTLQCAPCMWPDARTGRRQGPHSSKDDAICSFVSSLPALWVIIWPFEGVQALSIGSLVQLLRVTSLSE